MGLFSRKSKTKEAASSTKPTEEKPEAAPYKHIPKHAAIDSLGQAGRYQDNQQIALASQHRLSNAAFDSTLGNASYRQSMALSMFHGMPSPGMPSPAASYISSSRRSTSPGHRYNASEVFMTDPDAPPMPMPSPQVKKHNSAMRRQAGSRAQSDYFSHPGMTKDMTAEQEEDYSHANHSSDSGYGSVNTTAVHSRAASEKNLADDSLKHFLPEVGDGLLPDFNLTEELLNEPAFSEHSFSEDRPLEMVLPGPSRARASTLDASQTQPSTDRRSVKPLKTTSSVKKARFENSSATEQTASPPQHIRGRPSVGSDAATLAALQGLPSVEQQSTYNQGTMPKHLDFFQVDRPITPPSEDDGVSRQSHSRRPSSQGTVTGQEPRQIQRSNLPPLSLLEGFKVNKRGKILDEEGEPIGELVEGDIMDCVRQRVNAYGEVLDEFGGVVGIVRTIQRGTEPSQLRDSSPASFMSRRRQDVDAISPIQSGFVPEHMRLPSDATFERGRSASLPRIHQSVVAPLDHQDGSRVELDASIHSEAAPILDHSDIFSPPFIPSRSTRRPSPSSSVESHDAAEIRQVTALDSGASTPKSQPRTRDSSFGPIETNAKTQLAQEQARRPVRNHSDRSLSDLSKSYARPSMNSVPENNVPEDESFPPNSNAFAYKGEIPLKDGLQHSIRPTRHSANFSNGSANLPMRPSQFGGPPVALPRRVTTQSMSSLPLQRPGLSPRHSLNYPAKRSPLASHEATPNDSDAGTDHSNSDDGKFQTVQGIHSRSASIRTTNTTTSTMTGKPRSYFTHAGKIVVSADDETAPTASSSPIKAPTAQAADEKADKKKKRFTMSFGKKG